MTIIMTFILGIRAKLTEIYQKYDFIVNSAIKFLLLFFALKRAANIIGYNERLSGIGVVIAFSLIGAFLPPSLMVLLAVMYIFLQILTASVLVAGTVMLVFLVLYLFFLRFTPKEGIVVLATPLLISLGYPYAVPIFLGLFGSVLSVVPAACGIVAYYMIKAVTNNIVTIDQLKALKDQALQIYIDILDDLLNNPPMYMMIFVFAAVIITIALIRLIRMDYSFEISILVGTGVMILAFAIGSLMAGVEIEFVPMAFKSVICMLIGYVCMFFYRTLDYAGAERVQFEDERYYYYVTAVPKITADSPRRTVKKPKPQAEEVLSEDEEEAEAIEAMESMLSGNTNRPYAKPLTPSLAKRLRRDVAPRKESFDEEDEEDEVVIKGPKERSGAVAVVSEAFQSVAGKIKSILPGNNQKKEKAYSGEEDEENDENVIYFKENKDAGDTDEAEEPGHREDDYE